MPTNLDKLFKSFTKKMPDVSKDTKLTLVGELYGEHQEDGVPLPATTSEIETFAKKAEWHIYSSGEHRITVTRGEYSLHLDGDIVILDGYFNNELIYALNPKQYMKLDDFMKYLQETYRQQVMH